MTRSLVAPLLCLPMMRAKLRNGLRNFRLVITASLGAAMVSLICCNQVYFMDFILMGIETCRSDILNCYLEHAVNLLSIVYRQVHVQASL